MEMVNNQLDVVASDVQATMEESFLNAKKEIKKAGVRVRVNVMVCCRGCVSQEKLGMKTMKDAIVWSFGGQEQAVSWIDGLPFSRYEVNNRIHRGYGFTPSKNKIVQKIYFNHRNLTNEMKSKVVQIFENNGFVVVWDLSDNECLVLDLEATQIAMLTK